MAIFFISDTHFHHANILRYEPWRQSWARDVAAMNEHLIAEWNRVVGPGDVVYHLGDLALGSRQQVVDLRARLQGAITICIGNHDRTAKQLGEAGFQPLVQERLRIDGLTLSCRHDPTRFTVEEAAASDALLHGHWHGNAHHQEDRDLVVPGASAKLLDVGVDAWRRVAPIPADEVIAAIRTKLSSAG